MDGEAVGVHFKYGVIGGKTLKDALLLPTTELWDMNEGGAGAGRH